MFISKLRPRKRERLLYLMCRKVIEESPTLDTTKNVMEEVRRVYELLISKAKQTNAYPEIEVKDDDMVEEDNEIIEDDDEDDDEVEEEE